VCRHSEVKAVFVSSERLKVFAESWAEVESVGRVVVFSQYGIDESDDAEDEELGWSSTTPAEEAIADVGLAGDARVATLAAMLAAAPTGEEAEAGLPEADIERDFVCLYTSGTTGDPKGVVITNRALVTHVASNLRWLDHHNLVLTRDDCMFSFLPLAHIFAIQTETNIFCVGGRIAYYRGDLRLMLDDLMACRPTVFAGVPRVFARFQQKIRGAVADMSPLKRALFAYAFGSQSYNVRAGRQRTALWDALVFNKIRAGLLPEVRIIVSGSAPLSAETGEFLSVCLKVPIMQGYGSSETLGGVTCEPHTRCGDVSSCGPPLPGIEVKLVDIPAMDYLTSDKPFPRGEVCVRGPCLMSGYYKNGEETAKVFDDEGFFHTGDVGCRLADGSLTIIDRVKSLFKLAQGEYVSPESIENELCKAGLAGQMCVERVRPCVCRPLWKA
jgi:long-chain acyl-CoA synthetase